MAFQRSGFQRNAFQMVTGGGGAPVVGPVYGAGWNTPAWQKRRPRHEIEETQERIDALPESVSSAIKRAALLESQQVEQAFKKEMQGTEARFLKNYLGLLELYHGDLLAAQARAAEEMAAAALREEEELMLILLMSQ
jgi:hypothetical protein